MARVAQPEISGRLVSGDIRRNLGLCSKSTSRQWKKLGGIAETIPEFARNHQAVAKMAQNLKRVGYVGMALTGLDASINIRKTCIEGDDAACSKTKYTESGKAGLNILGGLAGGYLAAWGTCTLVFSLPSGGTSFFWYSIVAGASGGSAGGYVGGMLGEWAGNKLYEVKSL